MGFFDSVSAALGTDGNNRGLLQVMTGDAAAASDMISRTGREVAKSPLAQAAITAGGAVLGVPPMLTAGVLGANRAAQDGNIGAGLMAGAGSYMGGKAINSFLGAGQLGGLAKYGIQTGMASNGQGARGYAVPAALGIGALGALSASSTGGGNGGDAGSGAMMPVSGGANVAADSMFPVSGDAQSLRTRLNGDLSVLDQRRARLGDTAYRDGRIASTMADVQNQFDKSQDQSNRMLARMGVNPNSGRFAALAAQGGLGLAATKAGAANNERRAMDKEELSYLTSGADMARSGLQTASGMDAELGRLAIAKDQSDKQYQLGLSGADTARYNAETARLTGNSSIAAQQNKDDPLRTIAGAALGGYAGNADFRKFVNGGLSQGWDFVSGLFGDGASSAAESAMDVIYT